MVLKKITEKKAIELYQEYYNHLKGGIDGYYERMLTQGNVYLYVDDTEKAVVSYHEERGLTGIYVFRNYLNEYDKIVDTILGQNNYDKILFTDKDERYHNYLKKNGYNILLQAYNFDIKEKITTEFVMEYATLGELEKIENTFKDFLQNYKEKILKKQLFIKKDKKGNYIALGAYEPMFLHKNRACIAMKVTKNYQQKGYGVKTVQFLIKYLQSKGIEVNARCWYQNVASKKTLLKSGFVMTNKLLRIEDLRDENNTEK